MPKGSLLILCKGPGAVNNPARALGGPWGPLGALGGPRGPLGSLVVPWGRWGSLGLAWLCFALHCVMLFVLFYMFCFDLI